MSQHAEPALPSVTSNAAPRAATRPLAVRIPWAATWILLLAISAVINALLVALVHGTHGFFLPVLGMTVCILASLFDGWTQRIPNQLTYTAALLGIGLNAMAPLLERLHAQPALIWLGSAGFYSCLAGFLVCAVLGAMGSLLAGVHGGDLKLLAAVGAIAGFETTCNITMLALFFALIYAVVNLALFGRLTMVLRVAAQRVLEMLYLRRFQTPIPGGDKPTHIPMAIPLAVATIAVIYMQVRYGTGGVL